MSRKIIFDTDPGIDDALALHLLVNNKELTPLGLTTSFGNAHIDITTKNALHLLDIFGYPEIPVAKGAAKPLRRQLQGNYAYFVHGDDGLGNSGVASPAGKPVSDDAAKWMVETIKTNPGEITIVAVAPLTNLAQALALDPSIADDVAEVVIMGGAINVSGNINPAAEANIHNDPEAADAVFAADWPVTLFPLDVTEQLVMTPEYLQQLQQISHPSGEYLQRIGQFYSDYYQTTRGFAGLIPHDVTAVAYLLDESLYSYQGGAIHVITEGVATGMTVFDRRDNWNFEHAWSNRRQIKLATSIDAPRLLELFLTCAQNC